MKAPKMPRIDVPRTYSDYQAKQRQTGMFRQLAKPAKLSTSGAAKIRTQLKRMLDK